MRSVKGFLADFPMPILTNIDGEPTKEGLIDLHCLISGNVASLALNLGGGRLRHLKMLMTAEEYMEQTVLAFLQPHNPGNYPEHGEIPRTSDWN